MQNTKFELHQWVTKGNNLLSRSKHCFENAPSEKILLLSKRLPSEVSTTEQNLKLVFAGQYSAGKSTIIQALTGCEEIEIGADITTQQTEAYEWEGISIFDTPGVHTGIRPDHDEITYKAIAAADLLVFVVTNELFDSYIANHFRKLAIEHDKAHEMMLVVNKMRRSAKGNSLETQNIIINDLRKVLTPFEPEKFRISFIDAEAVLEAKLEKDYEIEEILFKKSGFNTFIEELNKFVREKGLSSKFTTSLYNLEQVLQEALMAESMGDKDLDALEELFIQRRRALLDTKNIIPEAVDAKIQKASSQVRRIGRDIADMIHGSADQEVINLELQAAQNQVQSITDELENTIQHVINKYLIELDDRVGDIINGELASELISRLEYRVNQTLNSTNTKVNFKNIANISSKLGQFLVRNSFISKAAGLGNLFKLNQYSGTATHSAVKTVGHFFGKSFKPWEAVKWTRTIANAGRVLAVAGTILTVVLQVKEDRDEEKLEIDLRESRLAVRSGFNEAANIIEMHFDKTTQSFVSNTITAEINNVDSQLDELREIQQTRSELFKEIHSLLDETRVLIKEIHGSELYS